MHPARLWKKRDNLQVQCRLCAHFCRIDPGGRGKCGVRQNVDGELYTLVYDRAAAVNVDPVEKKPLYHFLPGTLTFSLGTMGCNLSCSFCQNYSLSQTPKAGGAVSGHHVTPQVLVDAALRNNCQSISYTYSEPTIFYELMYDTAVLAKEQGLKNIIVSNGFQSPECLQSLGPYIDAANIDLKAFTPQFYEELCGAKLEPVKKNLKTIRELGWWLEVTTLLIPGKNDDEDEVREMAKFISNELGVETPWHLSRFHPDYNMRDREFTPQTSLVHAWEAGKEAGLHFVYVGNVPGNEHAHTLCPNCQARVIDRSGFQVNGTDLTEGKCTACGAPIAGVFS
ncbi:AmmeMemoRadiSam system radical SAM enzyme [Desulfovibrio inopinatus]|uniref:AmmeMemoRadiSam system radical SAM enzyme n=1 Tax=Desulfovibrio inopinatus TaxID=102109 RepID=UPI00040565E7|nr:AmmeMemoRadiSam system radical SAM enzyme [Desulfovibrio inopinatus]